MIRWSAVTAIAALVWAVWAAVSAHGGGIPLPAPAGTEWTIIAGYNTYTHSEEDQQDPHAIDIIRTDASTDWTPVLAPVNGEISWVGTACLTIRDVNSYAHLLCHIEPDAGVSRGQTVSVGDHLGRVFPAGYDENGGIAHIHYAIHETAGGGRLQRSIPFTGIYAIEGNELPWRDEWNLYADLAMTSTNGQSVHHHAVTPPTSSTDEDDDTPEPAEPESASEPEPAPAWTIPTDAPAGGWRTVGVQQRTSVAGLFAHLNAPLTELVIQRASNQSYDRFLPDDPSSAEIATLTLSPGQAVWASVEAGIQWLPAPPPEPSRVTISLLSGLNLVSWQGPDRPVSEALQNVLHLSHAKMYDPYQQEWQVWAPNAPEWLNTVPNLKSGDALYVYVDHGSTWTQLP